MKFLYIKLGIRRLSCATETVALPSLKVLYLNIAIIALTEQGSKTAQRIGLGFIPTPSIYVLNKVTQDTCFTESNKSARITLFSEPLQQLIHQIFKQYDGLVFVMAMGIVVRVIAPLVRDKHTDPAVVVVDDVGRFVISMLSGHEGGQINWRTRLQPYSIQMR